MDELPMDKDGIKKVNIIDFLLSGLTPIYR
jgi:hypothetical protein